MASATATTPTCCPQQPGGTGVVQARRTQVGRCAEEHGATVTASFSLRQILPTESSCAFTRSRRPGALRLRCYWASGAWPQLGMKANMRGIAEPAAARKNTHPPTLRTTFHLARTLCRFSMSKRIDEKPSRTVPGSTCSIPSSLQVFGRAAAAAISSRVSSSKILGRSRSQAR